MSFFKPHGATPRPDPVPNICSECGGKWLYGTPLHHCSSSYDNVIVDQYWCIECCEYQSSASWNDVEWGPNKFTVTCRAEGHA